MVHKGLGIAGMSGSPIIKKFDKRLWAIIGVYTGAQKIGDKLYGYYFTP